MRWLLDNLEVVWFLVVVVICVVAVVFTLRTNTRYVECLVECDCVERVGTCVAECYAEKLMPSPEVPVVECE